MKIIAAVTGLVLLAAPALAQDASQGVADGGIRIEGWQGKVDAREAEGGMTVNDARLASAQGGLHVRTGPAITYWKPDHTASGSYTVSATFRENEYMALNNHPHPYGVFVGGSGMGTEQQRYLYCAAYGNGTFIMRGFGPAPFQVNGRRGEANDAINKAAGKGEPVTQQIAIHVHPDRVECAINGTVVGSYPKADVLGDGKLGSTDGVYGLRFGHNTEAVVTGFGMQKR